MAAATVSAEGVTYLRAEPGSFRHLGPMRSVGRIGGCLGEMPLDFIATFERYLGPSARLLTGARGRGEMIADHDHCRIDGRDLHTIDHWQQVIASGRLADVRGAFAVAWSPRPGELRLARDPIGHRTLYYAQSN